MPVKLAEIITTKQLYQKTYGNPPDDYKDKVGYWKEYYVAMYKDGSFEKIYTHQDWKGIDTKDELLKIIDDYPIDLLKDYWELGKNLLTEAKIINKEFNQNEQ